MTFDFHSNTHTLENNSLAIILVDMKVTPVETGNNLTGTVCELSSEPYVARESNYDSYSENHIPGTSWFPL